MTTRRAKNNSVLHQARYSSSPDFSRGLLANLVAKRCTLLDSAEDRELIWFLQYISHQEGSLAAVAQRIIKDHPDQIQTVEMAQMNLKRGKICNAPDVRKLRDGMGEPSSFILKGEVMVSGINECVPVDREYPCPQGLLDGEPMPGFWREQRAKSETFPSSYRSDAFFTACIAAAQSNLERQLCELCLNPESSLSAGPWYFPRLIEILQALKQRYADERHGGLTVTSLGKKVHETLEYTAYSRGLTLMEGEARTGKSFAARTWCEQRPGQARFIEVPPGNDETGFFQAIARGIGLGSFQAYKANEIRARVESVLLTGNLMLVMDEAQRLWPQCNIRYGYPSRMIWIMTWANAGVPIAMVSTPQFMQSQKAIERKGWNSAQLTGRISHYEPLPAELSTADLESVARTILPEASETVLQKLATYAQTSSRYLAAIDAIAKRARFLAMRDGRSSAETEDVRRALQESVIPADSKLKLALASVAAPGRGRGGAQELEAAHISKSAPRQDSPQHMATPRRADPVAPEAAPVANNRHVRTGSEALLSAD